MKPGGGVHPSKKGAGQFKYGDMKALHKFGYLTLGGYFLLVDEKRTPPGV